MKTSCSFPAYAFMPTSKILCFGDRYVWIFILNVKYQIKSCTGKNLFGCFFFDLFMYITTNIDLWDLNLTNNDYGYIEIDF